MLSMVFLFGNITAIRLGILPPETLSPLLEVKPAQAATWDARVGRLIHTSNNLHEYACDPGYGMVSMWHDISNTWSSIWHVCLAGDW